jgi:hypothetical protein
MMRLGHDVMRLVHDVMRLVHDVMRLVQDGESHAHVKIGDFWFYGKAGQSVNFRRAASHYRDAERLGTLSSARACFNLGYMHQ